MEEDANANDYRIISKDTANAYQSKLYYDTTIVAGYNDNNSNVRYSRTSTPREHVRIQNHSGDDNSELEIGYKGLGSYAVDFRQYLYTSTNKPSSDEYIHSQDVDSYNYVKTTSYNTAANVKMDVTLPSDKFDTYYLKIDERAKDYIQSITVKRQDNSTYTINKDDLDKHFISADDGYGRINLLQSGDTFSSDNMFSDKESDYYKEPTTTYEAKNPIVSATIELEINQKATKKNADGTEEANNPDYGTWWKESDESTKYMFEFSGRFYKTGQNSNQNSAVAGASVASTVTIGGDNNPEHKNSKERSTTGSSTKLSGDSWSYKNKYYWYVSGTGSHGVADYKADHLYSRTNVIVVKDFNRISKGATYNATNDYNTEATIGDDNQYYIDFFRASRCDIYYGDYRYKRHYEAGSESGWDDQDVDDWDNKVGYADHVDIEDTLGLIQPDATYDYKGTLTTGLQFSRDIANYFKKGDSTAVELVLGKGTTNLEQNQNKTTYKIKKSDLKLDASTGYYVLKFNNDNDKLSDEDAAESIKLEDGVLYLEKNQYVLSFKAKLYDIKGNGEYNSEIKDNYYNYTDDSGAVHQGVDSFSSNNKDIIVNVIPYMVYTPGDIDNATNKVTTNSYYNNDESTINKSTMTNSSNAKDFDSAYIMGYRIPFHAGYQLDSLGAAPIDTKADVTLSNDANKTSIKDYITTDGQEYEKINGEKQDVTQNKTPTNAQFGVKIYNQFVSDTTTNVKNKPARIKELTTTDTMNTYYRMRNIYLPVQWIDNGSAEKGTKKTDNGNWFKVSKFSININNNPVDFYLKEKDDGNIVFHTASNIVGLNDYEIDLSQTKVIGGQKCYVLNIEDFVRRNKNTYLYKKLASGLIQVKVNTFNLTFTAKNPDFHDDESVMSNGDYLTSTKKDGEYSYFYDGTYVERNEEEFDEDKWTYDSVPTFGKTTQNYFVPASSGVANTYWRDAVYNTESVKFYSVDNNADTYSDVSGTKYSDCYKLRNAVAILTPNLTKERTLSSDSTTKLFAYDKDSNAETNSSLADPKQLEVDKDHLMPYDYVEYTLSSGNDTNAEIPLEKNHLVFTIGKDSTYQKGQQIVGWELIDAGGIIDHKTNKVITEDEITATLSKDGTSGTSINAKAGKDYSADVDGNDTLYRTITFDVGNDGTQIKAGQTIKIRIITQLTNEINGTGTNNNTTKNKNSYEGQTVDANAYAYADKRHGYRQYGIDGYSSTYYVDGTESNSTQYKKNASTDQNIEGNIYYYRYHSGDNYIARMASDIKFYNNKALTITYNYKHNDREFDSQEADLIVGNIQNDTMHFIDKQTVTVNFLQYDTKNDRTYQGYILDKIPTVSVDSAGNGDIYYPDQFITQVGRDNVKNIVVEYTTDDPNNPDAKWETATYQESIDVIHKIKGIRWTYFNVPSGYHSTTSVYSGTIEFADVSLKGQAHYEDVRTDAQKQNKTQRADIYTSHDTATVSHYKDHSETKDVIVDDAEQKVTVYRDVTLDETKEVTKGVYRESPQVILHPQVFDESKSDIATGIYDPSTTHDEEQKIGYRPNETYWQKISLVNQEMLDSSGTQNKRQGRLINPTIYDKIPQDYVTVNEKSLGFIWTDKNGTVKNGYHISYEDVKLKDANQYDYGGKMIYRKSTSVNSESKSWINIGGTQGKKAFDDLDTSEDYTLKTNYTLRKYQILDADNNPITMELGDRLTIYYKLTAKEDGLPMVYVDEDREVTTKDDQHPAYFPRVGEYYQFDENGYNGYYGYAYPFSNNASKSDDVHYREIQNSGIQMDMDYLLHDVGVSGTPNNSEVDAIKHDNIDNWEFLKDSIVYIPGDGSHTSYDNQRYGGGNNTLADYDISSAYYSQKTTYSPVQGAVTDEFPNYGDDTTKATSLKGSDKKERDWYEKVVKKRTVANSKYNSSENENWGSSAPIVWGQNRLHLQKAWLVSASEFMDAKLNDDGTLTDNDPNKEHRTYEATKGDKLTENEASNPNYYIDSNYSTYDNTKNEVHSLVDDNYEVGLEYNEEFTTKLQALNYGDWDLSGGVEFTYTMPRGIEPLIFDADGNVNKDKFKAKVLKDVSITDQKNSNIKTEEVNETYDLLSSSDIEVTVLQKPTTNGTYHYQAPSSCQDPQWQTSSSSEDYQTGDDTSPWVLKIVVKTNLKKWFNRGNDRGYKLNVYIPSKVVRTNENEEWFDRLQTRPYVAENNKDENGKSKYQDYFYYQILDYDHFEGTTKENMKNNQRFGMDYMWYRGSGYGRSNSFFTNSNYYYYNGSPNTPYIDGYNIQNQEVTISEEKGIYTAKATKNNADYSIARTIDRYSQTGTRAVMRKPLLRQWTTTGDDTTGQTLSQYYLDTEGTTSKLNIHVENKYYWDSLGTNYNYYYNRGTNYTNCTKEKHSYATDGGGRGTYSLPIITNILPYGIAPVGTDSANKSDIYSTSNSQNDSRTLNWKLLDLDGNELTDEQNSYDVKVTYEKIVRKTSAGEVVKDENGNEVTEGRYVVRFYPKEGADTKIVSGKGRTFSFDTFVYASPKVDTMLGDNKDLQDTYETNYTYLSSEISGFKALTDEDITNNPYLVGSEANNYNNYFDTDKNDYVKVDNRYDAIQKTYDINNKQTRVYGKLPNSTIKDKVTGDTHYVIGQGMEKVLEDEDKFNLEDYTKQEIDGIEQTIRSDLILAKKQRDFNMNDDNVHQDYVGAEDVSDIAYVNTIKIRTRQPNLTVENFVASSKDEVGKKTSIDKNAGSTEYTYDHDNDSNTPEVTKNFDYGDEVWYSAKLTNQASSTDYAHQGSVAHSRFVFSFHLPKAVSITDLPEFENETDHWDKFKEDDFVIELRDENGNIKKSVTSGQLKDSGFGIRIINKKYTPTSPENDHTGQIVTYEVTTPKDNDFRDYATFVNGNKPAGYLAAGDSLTLKIRTRVDNKELEGIDPTKKEVDVWSDYYSEVYSTLHTTNGEYIVTDAGKIYDDTEIPNGETPVYNGYEFNETTNANYDKSFTKQLNMTWLEKEVSDSKETTGEDGTKQEAIDYDQDGDYDEDFAYSSSAYINVVKPRANARIDTSKLRKRVNDLDADAAIIDDAHVRSADTMYMRLTQVENEHAQLNQFITSMTIPYYGTNKITSGFASSSDTEMNTTIKEIRTGKWKLPDNCANKEIYKQHLKVYLYAYMVADPWSVNGVIKPDDDSGNWKCIGKTEGYDLDANEIISASDVLNGQYIYQLNWVIKMEGFNEYSAENAAINYPVPVGLKLNTADQNGKEVDDNDPDRENTSEEIMHDSGVVGNCAYVSVVTGPRVSDGVTKHVNYFATIYGKYDDCKYGAISKQDRAGFYIDPELPTLEIDMEQAYFKASLVGEGTDTHREYEWSYQDRIIDDTASNVLKYRVTMKNKKKNDTDIPVQDNATNPNIAIALPYNEKLDTNKLEYVPYDKNASKDQTPADYLNDYYTSTKSLDDEIPLWTWYIVDENGSVVEPSGENAIQLKDIDTAPLVNSKPLTASRKEKSKILNFYFTGQLQPGQNLRVEIMTPVARMNANAISADLLRCKGYIFKDGSFTPYISDDEQGAVTAPAYEYDSQDINENKKYNDTALTKMTSGIGFTTTMALGQNKLVDTELETNVTNVPAAVNEGGDYTFKVSSISLTDKEDYQYKENVLYDVLPYDSDYYIYNTNAEGEPDKRNSQWNGWLNLDSIQVKGTDQGKETKVDSSQYDVWVGPIIKKDGKYVLNLDNGNPVLPKVKDLRSEDYIASISGNDDTERSKYFVKLSELKNYLAKASDEEKEKLTKGIRAIWLQMNSEYTIQPNGRLEMSYTMHAPQNIKKYVGTVKVKDGEDTASEITSAVKEFTGTNSFLSRAHRKGADSYETKEGPTASVYIDAPSERGYIGSYVWQDVNYDGKVNEGTYKDTYGIGRDLLVKDTEKYDLDNDGKNDDPGINDVVVELLTEHGRPANKEGEAIKEIDGKYVILNDETGEPELTGTGVDNQVVYRYSTSGPATFTTESDYYGNKGYFVFSNLKPGKYNLRYTLPKEYKDYSITTKELNTGDASTPVVIYRDGKAVYDKQNQAATQQKAYAVKKGTLVAQTAQSIQVDAVDEGEDTHQAYDEKAMGYDLGIGRTNLYKGTTWLDETEDGNGGYIIDGQMDQPQTEKRLGDIKVEAYEVDPATSQPLSDKPAIDADGNEASSVTKASAIGDLKAGEYQFRLVPGKTYIIKATNKNTTPLKATAPIYSQDPTKDTGYNDLLLQGGKLITNQFNVPYIVGDKIAGWEKYPDEHTIDLGFVNAARGFIGELVWDDKDYDGIQDPDEDPLENVTVTLEQYYYKDDKWHKLDEEKTTQTNDAGAYKFTVSTYYEDGNDRYLAGYKVRIDRNENKDLFKQYAPTFKGNETNGKQSDLDETPNDDDGNSYYLTDDVVVIASEVGDTTQEDNSVECGDTYYDLGNAETKNFDAGFKAYESGKIDGIVWLDSNYDGIRDANENIADKDNLTDNEKLLAKIKAQIKGYYYDNGKWNEANDAKVQWSTNDVELKLADDGYYHYTFKDLPTEVQDSNGKTYLMGYKVTLDGTSIDKTLKPTLSYQTASDKDSDLVKRSGNYALMKKDDYVITAKKLSDTDKKHDGTLKVVDGNTYDLLQHQNTENYDAGLTGIETSAISGQVWIDDNYDGIQDDDENPLNDVEVKLVRYIVTKDNDGKLVYTKDTSYSEPTVETGDKGGYKFEQLEDSPNDGERLYAYQVVIDPSQTAIDGAATRLGITKYHEGTSDTKDSDWSNDGTLLDNSGDYLILLNKANDSTPDANNVLGYDIVKGKAYNDVNAGATPYQNGKISGNIFDDKDYNGLNTKNDDKGVDGVEVVLKQYYIDENNEYVEIPEGSKTTTTNSSGDYSFDNLPTNGYINSNGTNKRVIYRYTVSVKNLPNDYVVTKYHKGKDDERDSNIDPQDQQYTLKDKSGNPYIILAKKSDNDKLAQYLDGYDLIENKDKTKYDGGITQFHKGTISGTIFDDKDYNGLLGEEDQGYKDITVILTQYQKVGDEYIPTGMIDSVETDENGKYTFKDIETNGFNEEGNRILYAYRVTLDESTLPEEYGITKYRVNDKDESSKLSSDYELISNKENQFKDSQEPFIIMAEKTDDESIPYNIDGYDVIENNSIKELNGGIKKIEKGSITGTIFDDEDYDGLLKR